MQDLEGNIALRQRQAAAVTVQRPEHGSLAAIPQAMFDHIAVAQNSAGLDKRGRRAAHQETPTLTIRSQVDRDAVIGIAWLSSRDPGFQRSDDVERDLAALVEPIDQSHDDGCGFRCGTQLFRDGIDELLLGARPANGIDELIVVELTRHPGVEAFVQDVRRARGIHRARGIL